MNTYTFHGDHATAKLRDELLDAGIDAHLQVEENAAVAVEEPVLDANYEFVVKDGKPVTELRWYTLNGREPVKPKKVPADATSGTHIQLGPPTLTVTVEGNATEAQVRKVVEKHDPTPPAPEPTLEERLAALEKHVKPKP